MVHRGHLWMRISGIKGTSTGPEDQTAPYLTRIYQWL